MTESPSERAATDAQIRQHPAFTPGTWNANDWAIRAGNEGHSPGPGMWEVDVPESGHTIALALSQGDADVERANAHVLAAAKDLYDACEGLVGIFAYLRSLTATGAFVPFVFGINWQERVAAAEAALAKARGEETAQ